MLGCATSVLVCDVGCSVRMCNKCASVCQCVPVCDVGCSVRMCNKCASVCQCVPVCASV